MKTKIYIILFAILYLIVAFSSFFHAVEFFELSNNNWMSIILALAFEIGQAAVLMSILTSKQEQSKFTPWILMVILTLVQIIGNVYSSYKYILTNSLDNLKFFKEPIFIWTNLPDDQATVIVTYVSASILPIVALLMTALITNYITKEEQKEQEVEKEIEEKIEQKIEEEQNYVSHPQILPKTTQEIKPTEELKEPEVKIEHIDPPIYTEQKYEEPTEPPVEISKDVEDVFDGPIVPEVNFPKQKSHFVNI